MNACVGDAVAVAIGGGLGDLVGGAGTATAEDVGGTDGTSAAEHAAAPMAATSAIAAMRMGSAGTVRVM